MSLQNYLPGDVIISNCQPILKISNKIRGCGNCVCESCFCSPEDNPTICLIPCPGCALVLYCSAGCSFKDWKNGHMIECGSKTFANNFNQVHSEYVVNKRCQIFRTMAFFVINPEEAEKLYELYNGKFRCFNDLMSHQDYFDNIEGGRLKIICKELADEINLENLIFDGQELKMDSKYLLRLGGILQINSFTMCNQDETAEVGCGIFIQASVFDHSCKPTAVFHFTNDSGLEIRAIAPINKGEEPFISYISDNGGKQERQEILKEHYNFECLCDRCANPLDDNTDYDLLNRLIYFSTANQEISLTDTLRIHQIAIKIMKQIYHNYDTRITKQYITTLNILISNDQFTSSFERERLSKFIQDTKERVGICYGQGHPHYLKIEQICKNDF